MSEFYLRQKLSEHTALCVSELSEETLSHQSGVCASELNADLFLYLVDERPSLGGITVLANVPSHEAATFFFDSVLGRMKHGF